ncbi:MAG: hypothetical protein ACI39R_07725 [Lachnospiraceae bacterium]
MKKILIRAGVLFVVFILALIFFYYTVEEHSFSDKITTVEATEAKLPVVSFMVNGNEINQTKGYTVLQENNHPRDSVTPISTAQTFSILIKEKGCKVKLLSADVLDLPGLSQVSHFETNNIDKSEDGRLIANITVTEPLAENTEYLLRVTLTTSDGDKVYYYTRLQVATYGSLTESLNFVNNFHASTLDKDKVYDLDNVMESDDDKVIEDYSHIDITADLDTLSYGSMAPEEIYKYVPTITEYNEDYVSATLRFWLQAYTSDGKEIFECKEDFRFQYSSYKTFLFNYDRTMETCYDGSYFTVGKNEMKLGITQNKDVDSIYCEDKTQMLFSYQGSLWHLDMNKNKLVNVLSYRNEDYDRNDTEDYNFKLLSIDQNGNADFVVYGYIGKGVYEGRIGILYYRYYAEEGRIEEKMFIPVSVEYSELEASFGTVSYTSKYDIFYFTLFDAYYSYELETNVIKTEVQNLGENWLYFEKQNLICYDENPGQGTNSRIVVLDVINQTKNYIEADEGKTITLLGTVDNRLVYGNGNADLISYYKNGKIMQPLDNIIISETDGTVIKTYKPSENLYVGEVEFNPGVININLYRLISEKDGESKAAFAYADKDVIINLNKTEETSKTYSGKLNEGTKKEYYLTLPSAYAPEKNPEKGDTVSTVITTDTSAVVKSEKRSSYHVIAYGENILSTDSLGDALVCADSSFGTVIDNSGNVLWRRGVVKESITLNGVSVSYVNDSRSGEQAVIQMIMDYCGIEGDAATFNMKEKSMLTWLADATGYNVATVEEAALSQVLYFVSDGHPVVASLDNYYVVIIGYTKGNVIYLDPVSGQKVTKTKENAEELFQKAGGLYYVYY